MKEDNLYKLVQSHCNGRIQHIEELTGGFRNRVYRVYTDDKSIVVKQHMTKNSFDFFLNEITGYRILSENGCKIPRLLFTDESMRVLGLEDVAGVPLEEGREYDFYLRCADLLCDTYERTEARVPSENLFFRHPKGIFDGLDLLRRHVAFKPSEEFIRFATQSYDLLINLPQRLCIGSFIPSNVIRGKDDYHIDLEMLSYGSVVDDIAYFVLFAGAQSNKLMDAFQNKINFSFDAFYASLLHLSVLTAGIYADDMETINDVIKKKRIHSRMLNFAHALRETESSSFSELVEFLEEKYGRDM